jgi:hypothetical protein
VFEKQLLLAAIFIALAAVTGNIKESAEAHQSEQREAITEILDTLRGNKPRILNFCGVFSQYQRITMVRDHGEFMGHAPLWYSQYNTTQKEVVMLWERGTQYYLTMLTARMQDFQIHSLPKCPFTPPWRVPGKQHTGITPGNFFDHMADILLRIALHQEVPHEQNI